jgi:tetratricopeptide (TPR) repeat protein
MPEPSPHAAADRNLLFGILALQMDFISRDALRAAVHAWAESPRTPLDQVLRAQGALDTDGHAQVEALLPRGLAALGALGQVRKDQESTVDPQRQPSLAAVTVDRPAETDQSAGEAATVGTATSSGQRFRILRPHARGGLGEVFVARDEELHREVALKEIQQRHADQPDSRARFLLEAEITGGLEHPGIVPVYGLGAYPDGRPFYAMRLIRGDSLKDAIQHFHQADVPGRDPGERAVAYRGLLRRFLDMCNAVAYAHGRGVLHRDLKPGNVMLGKYGETLVVDWGLAKAVGRAEGATGAEEGTLRPTAASDSAPTQLGTALGTPAYMSPEQAAGRLDQLGPASDVYSLGATLYCLLTGRAPFTRADLGAVLPKVQRGEFPPPRQVKGNVPPALEAICLKAMALRPEERYASPQALADDLEHWLADEPVRAYREPLLARLGRWRRRHRGLVAGVTAAALVALLLGGIGLYWLVEQAAELRRGVEAALDQATERQQQARWAEAEAVLEQAQARLGESGPQDLQQRVAQARADLGLVRRLDAARLRGATIVEGQFDYAGAERDYAAAFRQAQLGRPGDNVAAVAARMRRSAIQPQLVAALDDWVSCTLSESRRAWLLAVARRADPDQWRDRFRDPRVGQQPQALERLARQAQRAEWSPQLVTTLARVLRRRGGDAVPLLQAAQARHPQDFWLNFQLGDALDEAKRPEAAIGYYRAALALRPHTNAVYNNLGNALAKKGDLDGAIACYKKALAIDPKHALAHYNLGNALREKGELDRAIACYEKALALHPKYAWAPYNLGNALKAKGDLDGAIACYRKALALDPKYAKAHYNLGNALKDKGALDRAIACYEQALAIDPKDAMAHTNLGVALHDKGELDRAIACYHKALALDPKDAYAHTNLGTALKAKGDQDGAIACYRKALAIGPKLAGAHYNLGTALYAKGQLDGAIACWQKAIALDPKHAPAHHNLGGALTAKGELDRAVACYAKALALDPKNAKAHYNLGSALHKKGALDRAIACYEQALALDPKNARAHTNLGVALHDKGELDRAIACYRKALAIDRKHASAHANLGAALQAKGDLGGAIACYHKALALDPKYAKAHYNLGNALREKGELDRAIACYEKALALDPKLATAHTNLGVALAAKGQLDGAVACFEKALAIDPKDAKAHYNLGHALQKKGRLEEAIACYQKAIALGPKNAPAHNNLGWALYNKGQWDGAAACYRQALALDPKDAWAHNNLGLALQAQGQLDGAIACYRQALALGPKNAPAHNNLGWALYNKGQWDGAAACYRQALALDPKDAWAHNNLGLALQAQGQLDRAIASYRQALALDPKNAPAHNNLGWALYNKGQLAEAIAWYQKAIALHPGYALAHNNLGLALYDLGRVDQAIASLRQAIVLDPKLAWPHGNLGRSLHAKGRLGEAIAECKKAVLLDPNNAWTHGTLGWILHAQGRLGEAIAEYKKALAINSRLAWVHTSLKECQQCLALAPKLPAILKGEIKPASPAEHIEYAWLCKFKKLYLDSARLFAAGFAADPKLAEDLKTWNRYNAACCAVLAAAGQGLDAGPLSAPERARLRRQALLWLRADLARWSQQLAQGTPQAQALVRQTLAHWQRDPDLAGIRDAAGVAWLPEAERIACRQFWADVDALLKRAGSPK